MKLRFRRIFGYYWSCLCQFCAWGFFSSFEDSPLQYNKVASSHYFALQAFMREMVSTIHKFGVKVIGYCAWSIIDSYEWSKGFRWVNDVFCSRWIESMCWSALPSNVAARAGRFRAGHFGSTGHGHTYSSDALSDRYWVIWFHKLLVLLLAIFWKSQ